MLTSLPAEIGQLAGLTVLDLHHNQLTSLPAEIGQLAGLTVLHLNSNQLTSLPAEISQLASLTVLDLGDNQLTSLPAEIVSQHLSPSGVLMYALTIHDNWACRQPHGIVSPRQPADVVAGRG